MDIKTGRPNHIEDYLIKLHKGGWFTWSDPKNKIYANLRLTAKIWNLSYTGNDHEEGMIDNPYSKPSESDCTNGLKALQDSWDAEHDSYKSKRRAEYKSVADQLDQLYHDMTAGKLDGTGEWHKSIKAVKDKYAKS